MVPQKIKTNKAEYRYASYSFLNLMDSLTEIEKVFIINQRNKFKIVRNTVKLLDKLQKLYT